MTSRKFSGMKYFNPNVRLTNQKPRAFVVSVFISRSCENRSKTEAKKAFKHKAYPLENGRRRKRPSLLTRLPWGLADSKQTKMLAAKGTVWRITQRGKLKLLQVRLLMRSRQKKYSLTNYLQTLQQFAKWQRLSYEGKEGYKVHRTFQRIHIVRRGESKGPYGISAEKT